MPSLPRSRLAGPVALAAILLAAAPSTGCVSSHFQAVVRGAAASRASYCGGVIAVRPLSDWGYAVDACEETTYYRCFYQRRSGGHVQCCHPVPDEGAATSLVSFEPERDVHCVEFDH
jgi:hypothetical protein